MPELPRLHAVSEAAGSNEMEYLGEYSVLIPFQPARVPTDEVPTRILSITVEIIRDPSGLSELELACAVGKTQAIPTTT